MSSRELRIGVRIPPCQPVDKIVAHAQVAEDLGFDEAWFPDSQLLWRDVFCVIAEAAIQTRSIGLGTAVTNFATRHPSVMASAARTVAELAPGRFTLGVGVGNSSVAPIGVRPSTQTEMRSGIEMVRTLLRGDSYDFGGGLLSRLREPIQDVPIFMAATGPRNLRLAGELADGVLLLSGISPATLTRSTALISEGVAASGQPDREVALTVSAYCHVTDDIERDARRLKPICVGIAQNGGRAALSSVGIDLDPPSHVDGVYPDLVHAEDWDAAVERCSEWVSDADAVRFAQSFCLFGTGPEILAGLRAARRAGATSVFLQHVGSYDAPSQMMRDVAAHVLPWLDQTSPAT